MFSSGAQLTGSINGGAGSDTLDLTAYGTNLDVTLTATGGTDGFKGNSTGSATNPISGTFNNIDVIDAGTGNNTLTGLASAGTWNLNAVTTYVNGNTLTFSGFGTLDAGAGGDTFNLLANQTLNLNGGSGSDAFVFSDGVVLTGAINGGGGSTDTLDLSAYSSSQTWTLSGTSSGSVAPVTGGFSNIDVVFGGSGGDTFDVTVPTNIALHGGAGTDTLNYSDQAQVVLTGLSAKGVNGTDNSLTGGFFNMDLINSAAGGTLTGDSNGSGNAWDVTGASQGTYTDNASGFQLQFAGFDNLIGGTTGDGFTLENGGML